MGKTERPQLGLFWVETDDHHEDWFVIAPDEQQACFSFEEYEGYETGDAKATLVAPVPDDVECNTGWPSDEELKKCGATILRAETPRVVELAGRRFCEGILEHEIRQKSDDEFEAKGMPRMNNTTRAKET